MGHLHHGCIPELFPEKNPSFLPSIFFLKILRSPALQSRGEHSQKDTHTGRQKLMSAAVNTFSPVDSFALKESLFLVWDEGYL